MSARNVTFNLFLLLGVILAAYLLYNIFSSYSLDEIRQSIAAIPAARLVSAVVFCALSYLCLTGFDWLALRYVGKPLSYPKAAITSFTALSIGHNLGVAALSSGAVRYRYYTRWGLTTQEVAKVILFCGTTVALGLSALAGVIVLINPADVTKLLRVGYGDPWWLGVFCLLVPIVYLILSATVRSSLRLWKWRFEMPDIKIAIGQVAMGTLNFIFVAACLHQVVAGDTQASFVQSATAFVLANIAVLVTHVPGGLGVLEATVSVVLQGAASIGGLVAFRVIYFVLPLFVGLPVFAISELVIKKTKQSDKCRKHSSDPQAQLL